MANSGRPKKDDCNNIIKVSVNDETASMLDTAASLTGKSKSDILRELIPLVSSRTFEDMISSTNMELLQQYSEDCWRTLHTEGCIFETAYFSDKMPAFISTMEHLVYVKYPTFKIEILNEQKPIFSNQPRHFRAASKRHHKQISCLRQQNRSASIRHTVSSHEVSIRQ